MAALDRLYTERPSDVLQVLNDNAITRIREVAIQAFPTAFLLPKKD